MKKIIKRIASMLVLVPAIALGVSAIAPVAANAADNCSGFTASSTIQDGANCSQGNGTSSTLFGGSGIFTTIVNILLYIIGAIAVIMLIIGGIRYVTSGGDSSAVTAAKNTILYAIIGIIVALLAYAIVNFVLASLLPGGSANQ